MSGKVKRFTRKQLHRARLTAEVEAHSEIRIDKGRERELAQQEAEMERVTKGCVT